MFLAKIDTENTNMWLIAFFVGIATIVILLLSNGKKQAKPNTSEPPKEALIPAQRIERCLAEIEEYKRKGTTRLQRKDGTETKKATWVLGDRKIFTIEIITHVSVHEGVPSPLYVQVVAKYVHKEERYRIGTNTVTALLQNCQGGLAEKYLQLLHQCENLVLEQFQTSK